MTTTGSGDVGSLGGAGLGGAGLGGGGGGGLGGLTLAAELDDVVAAVSGKLDDDVGAVPDDDVGAVPDDEVGAVSDDGIGAVPDDGDVPADGANVGVAVLDSDDAVRRCSFCSAPFSMFPS